MNNMSLFNVSFSLNCLQTDVRCNVMPRPKNYFQMKQRNERMRKFLAFYYC